MTDTPTAVAENTAVSLAYTLTVDGKVVDSSPDGSPLEYLQGHQNIIPGLERELTGMKLGEQREILVVARDAYGEYDPEAKIDLERAQLPADFHLEIGGRLRVRDDDGRVFNAEIKAFDQTTIHLDLNHPLAGKDLRFLARVVDLRAATLEEITRGRLACASCSSGDCSSGCE